MVENILLRIAKTAILSKFEDTSSVDGYSLLREYPYLQKDGASFVTLKYDGNLRGCIGSIVPHRRLIDDIVLNAISASFKDPRFNAISSAEFSHLNLEVSILSEPEILEYEDYEDLLQKVRPNIDGLILTHKGHQGTFLPQVWEQLSSAKEFLEHLSTKAGATPSIYSEHPTVYRYEVEHIQEEFDKIQKL
ncbi:AmmeMemoRadiSam system protein A [Sulfurimonas sp.]|uniref:AmmeMemoRadiSam system protein A n=1 Tax=Sulfurimonas sp. TaxID=2022749 RepID=UPI0025E03E30|nr:AmmeMemoRadiSam system protein A [Sulfurimonas sp.]